MQIVAGHTEKLARWAADRIPHVGDAGFGPCEALGVALGNRLLAVWVFHTTSSTEPSRCRLRARRRGG